MNLARFYRKHLLSTLGGSHLPLLSGFEPASEPASTAIVSLDWSDAPIATDPAASAPADRHESVVAARHAAETAAFAALASNPRRLRAFRRLLADAQHLVPIREEQTSELTIAWPVLRRAVVRIGEALVADGVIAEPDDVFFMTRDEALAALSGTPAGGSGPGRATCGARRAGPSRPANGRGPREPVGPKPVGQLSGDGRSRSVGIGTRVGRASIGGSSQRPCPRDPRAG